MHACSFTGHRPTKLPYGYNEQHRDCLELKKILSDIVYSLAAGGVEVFYTGMAEGADIWAAEAVLELKESFPQLRLVAAIPCADQASRWSAPQRERYNKILARCDERVTLAAAYHRGCMAARNRYLVDRCDVLVALFGGGQGGTKSTVDYAARRGRRIIRIDPITLEVKAQMQTSLFEDEWEL